MFRVCIHSAWFQIIRSRFFGKKQPETGAYWILFLLKIVRWNQDFSKICSVSRWLFTLSVEFIQASWNQCLSNTYQRVVPENHRINGLLPLQGRNSWSRFVHKTRSLTYGKTSSLDFKNKKSNIIKEKKNMYFRA